jgi:hypothetical protein
VKVGVKCAAECATRAAHVEIRDASGRSLASGPVGATPLSGTAALHYAELELTAPAVPGLETWEARVPAVVAAPDQPAHAAASAHFQVRAVPAPDCVLTVVAVDAGSRVPVPGAKVVVHPYRAVTNAAGVAEIRVPKGAYRLFVSGRDRFPFRSDGEIDGDVTVHAELEADLGPSDAELWS